METRHLEGEHDAAETLYMAMELSRAIWMLAFSTSTTANPRLVNVSGGELEAVLVEVANARKRFGLAAGGRTVSC